MAAKFDKLLDKALIEMLKIMEVLRENETKFSDNKALEKETKNMLQEVDEFFKDLPEDERDRLLELYKKKMDGSGAKKTKRNQRKK